MLQNDEMRIHLTPRGEMAFRMMDEIDRMLAEQKQGLCDLLQSALQSMSDHDSFETAIHLMDIMSMVGLIGRVEEIV